jgi:hypothetical protein
MATAKQAKAGNETRVKPLHRVGDVIKVGSKLFTIVSVPNANDIDLQKTRGGGYYLVGYLVTPYKR